MKEHVIFQRCMLKYLGVKCQDVWKLLLNGAIKNDMYT